VHGLGVHDQPLATCLDVLGSHRVGGQHHQVCFERQRCVPARRGDDRRPEGEIGHELAVHDIPLDPVDSGGLERCHLVAQLGEVGW
jgi:hypothetical protein